jgi:hypothetical protein
MPMHEYSGPYFAYADLHRFLRNAALEPRLLPYPLATHLHKILAHVPAEFWYFVDSAPDPEPLYASAAITIKIGVLHLFCFFSISVLSILERNVKLTFKKDRKRSRIFYSYR